MQKPLHLTRDGGNRFVEVSGGQQRNARELAPGRTQSMDPPPADRWWCVCSTHTMLPIALRLKVNVAAGFLALGGDLRKKWTQAIIWWDFMIQNFA